jgi:CDP-diacylglycerol--glycerol-3-phosphate 3-phosphatidyltransferase
MSIFSNGVHVLSRLPAIDLIPLLGLPIFWIICFVYFWIRSAMFGMPRTARIDKIAQSPYLPRLIMEFGYWMFTLPIRAMLRLGVTPNMLTFGSLVVTIASAVAIGLGYFSVGGWTLFLAFMMDAWDGIIARETRVSSVSGEFLDATVDRYNDLIGFLGLMYYYRDDALPLALAAASLVGSTLVSYTRAKGEAVGVDPNVGWMQRHERAVYLGISTVMAPIVAAFVEGPVAHPRFHLVILALAIMAFTTNVTAVWRARVVLGGLRKKGLAPERRPRALPSNDVERIKAAS